MLMLQPLKKYADFQGRARRSEYWLWFLFQCILSILFMVLTSIIGATGKFLEMAVNLGLFIPTIAVAVRRFHDIGRTGWWCLFNVAVLVIGLIAYLVFNGTGAIETISKINFESLNQDDPASIMAALAPLSPLMLWVVLPFVLASLVTLVFNLQDGTPKPNRFGNDPKGRGGNDKTADTLS